MSECKKVLVELLDEFKIIRKDLFQASSLKSGHVPDPSDRHELAVMDRIIKRAEKVLASG